MTSVSVVLTLRAMFSKLIPRFYRSLRQRRHLSQLELGRRIGKCKATLIAWEKGRTRPKPEDETLLLEALACTPQEFIEICCELMGEDLGQTVAILWEDGQPPAAHPLTRAERLFEEHRARLPERLAHALNVRIAALRTRDFHHQQSLREVEELLHACLEACDGQGGDNGFQRSARDP